MAVPWSVWVCLESKAFSVLGCPDARLFEEMAHHLDQDRCGAVPPTGRVWRPAFGSEVGVFVSFPFISPIFTFGIMT